MNSYEWICDAKEHFHEVGGNGYQSGDSASSKSKEINKGLQELIKTKLESQEKIILNLMGSKWCIQGQSILSSGIWYRAHHKDFGANYPVVFGVYLGSNGLNIAIQIYNNLLQDKSLLKMLGDFIKNAVEGNGLEGQSRDDDNEPYSDYGFFDIPLDKIDEKFTTVLDIYQKLPATINTSIFKKMIELYQTAPESHHCQIADDNKRYKERLEVKKLVNAFVNATDDLEEKFRKFWNREMINSVQQGASAGNVIERNAGIEKLREKIKKLINLGDPSLDDIQGCVTSSRNSSLELYYLYHMSDDRFPLINGGIRNAIEIIQKNKVEEKTDLLKYMENLKDSMTRTSLYKLKFH